MTTQSEAILESNLVNQLAGLGNEKVDIRNEIGLLDNLKTQLGKFNNTVFSTREMDHILNHLAKGNVF